MHGKLSRPFLTLAVIAALVGCVTYGPDGLAPRASLADATRAMGAPSGEYALPGSGKRLEFARGPYGRHTYMLDFDAQGRLVSTRQVLTEPDFDALRSGMSADEVLARIGHPAERFGIAVQRQTVWAYRYESPFCRWFQVGIGSDGRVADTAYGPDPRCESNRDDRDL